MPNQKTVPLANMPVGQWFLWCYPQETRQPYRKVRAYVGDEREDLILYPDGRAYTDTVGCEGVPIDGPDVDFEAAYQSAMRPTAGDLEPGTRFAVEWPDLGRKEYVKLDKPVSPGGFVSVLRTYPVVMETAISAGKGVEVL